MTARKRSRSASPIRIMRTLHICEAGWVGMTAALQQLRHGLQGAGIGGQCTNDGAQVGQLSLREGSDASQVRTHKR
jgi:hypothetical protein